MSKSKSEAVVTFEYRLTDKDGNPKPIWQENKAGRFIREKLGMDIQKWPLGKWSDVMINVTKKEL